LLRGEGRRRGGLQVGTGDGDGDDSLTGRAAGSSRPGGPTASKRARSRRVSATRRRGPAAAGRRSGGRVNEPVLSPSSSCWPPRRRRPGAAAERGNGRRVNSAPNNENGPRRLVAGRMARKTDG